jgi:hypothetical protein
VACLSIAGCGGPAEVVPAEAQSADATAASKSTPTPAAIKVESDTVIDESVSE